MRITYWLLVVGVLSTLLMSLQNTLRYGNSGFSELNTLRTQLTTQQAQNQQFLQRNRALAAEVKDLQVGGEALEERARSELGMIKPGEKFYRRVETFQEDQVPAANRLPSAK